MLHDRASNNVRTLHVTPGHNQFLTVPVLNSSNQNEVYSVRIIDPDQHLFKDEHHGELKLVTEQAELSHWVVMGKVNKPPAWNLVTTNSDVVLKPGQQLDLLFKYLTHRDVSLSEASGQSKKAIRRRTVQVVIVMRNQQIYQ